MTEITVKNIVFTDEKVKKIWLIQIQRVDKIAPFREQSKNLSN